MAKKSQRTQMYVIDPDDDSIIEVDCVLNIDGIDTTNEQIESTCLSDEVRTYQAGMATPGQASFGINIDPSNASHVRLHQLKVAKADLKFAVGWEDGYGIPPTVETDGEFILPDTRSWITYEGFISSFPFTFAQNAFVTSNVTVQVSGEPVLTPKAP